MSVVSGIPDLHSHTYARALRDSEAGADGCVDRDRDSLTSPTPLTGTGGALSAGTSLILLPAAERSL